MPTQPYYFDLLKKYVLVKAGISTLSPGDCKLIALDIKKATGNVVSETTLKRFFGFANKKYNLSKFTINTLSEYVGYHGWDAFQQAVDVSANGEIFIQSTNWKQLRQRAEVITHITLKTIQNHSGIPWDLTIPRQFVEKDFSYFIDSAYKFTTFVSAPSSGRSLLLAHLVEDFFVDRAAPHHNSIVWFVNAGILNSLGAYGFHLDDWFNEQLGLVGETTFREYFQQHPEEVNGKIFLILDGFDEYMFTDEQLTKLFNNITDLVCYNDEIHWLKVVVSMRTSTWQRMEEKLMDSEYLRKQWYPGVFFRKEHHANMPPLNNEEIKDILSNIEKKPVNILQTPASVLHQFRQPFYLQLYFQIKEKEQDFHHTLPYAWHELVSECVMKKLYLTRRSTEKILMLNRFIALTDNGNDGNKIEKKELLAEINQYPDAYEELISSGIWTEGNHSRDMTHKELIFFSDENVFQYFIARKLIEQYGHETFPGPLLKEIRNHIASQEIKKVLLQWIVRYAIKENKLEAMGKIFRSGLFSREKNQLALFACALLNKEKYTIPEETQTLPSGISSFTEEFLDFELVNPTYEPALRTLADFSGEGINKINIYCILAASALMEMNKDKTTAYLRILKREDESLCRKTYPIHPIRCLRFIASFFMENQQQEEILEEIECFIKNPPTRFKKRSLDCSLSISYHLAVIAWSLTKDANAVISLIFAIRKIHPSIFIHRSTSLSAFLLNRLGVAFTITGQFKEAERLNDHLKKRNGFPGSDSLTNGTSMLTGLLDAVILEHHGKTAAARDMRLMAYNIAARHFPLMQAYIGSILVETYKRQDDFEKATSALKEMTEVMQKEGFVLDKLLLRRLTEVV